MVISGRKSSWRPVTSRVTQGSILVPFVIFVNGLDDAAECTPSKFAHDTMLREMADTPETSVAIQMDLTRLVSSFLLKN